NMMDVVKKNGDVIKTDVPASRLGCKVVEISALKNTGIEEAAQIAVQIAKSGKRTVPQHSFSGCAEHAIAHIEEAVLHNYPEEQQRWYAIKIFERDEKVLEKLRIPEEVKQHIEIDIQSAEAEMDDDSESIITNERYVYISDVMKECCKKKNKGGMTVSDKIDKVVTNRFLALPIFALIMFIVYYVSITTVGAWCTDWTNDVLFGEWIPDAANSFLENINCADWLKSLIVDGIIGGVGAVLGFVPQMLVLFIFLAFLEACGYMARIAFVMDRIFRKFGLSGKSFIPMLIGTGCGVPAIMASRTIENECDRRMTIMTTTFIPCGAKLPIIGLIAGAFFNNSGLIAVSAYFIGVLAIIISGIILKKTRIFSGDPAPFVMELPAYHMPTFSNVMRSMWERGWSFIKKAGTVILLSTVFLWFLQGFGVENGSFGMIENLDNSILANIGNLFAWIFRPLGWGDWKATVASLTGLIAKENVVATFGTLFHFGGEISDNGDEIWQMLAASYTSIAAFSFLVFNLLCAPCFAAIGAIRREMNSAKWTWFAIGYQCGFAYAISLIIYQFGSLFSGSVHPVGLVVAVVFIAFIIYLLFRPAKESGVNTRAVKA
ncbi:MAG: ferrous iron transport protein B, partial [Prevotella sp.]|nr:ferrous iron transport protein B [Prevotella sp.]